jgi:DNA-binding ferritin-like protein
VSNYDRRGVSEGTWAVFAEKVVAERDALAERLRESEAKRNALVVDILEHLPPHIFDDDGPDDTASEREVIEYAGDEIRRLRARAERAESERDEARAQLVTPLKSSDE